MPQTVEELLASTTLFRRVTGADRLHLAAVAHGATYKRGTRLFTEGDPADYFLTIVKGRVKIFKSLPTGKDVILEIFGAGDPLGAVAVFEGRPFPASAMALEDTTCLVVARRDMFALMEAHPSLARGLLAGLTLRLIELTNRIAELTGGRIEPRFARLFLKMADESGQAGPRGTVIPAALSRQELADLTGTTIETAIRIMSRWEKEEIVRTEKHGFVILDREALRLTASS